MTSLCLASRLVSSTALIAFASIGYAQDAQISQLTNSLNLSGGNDSFAYTLSPQWSDKLGAHATGSIGFELQNDSALGLMVTGGERKREVLLNFGIELDAERKIVLTAGQLREKLEFGTAAEQEWVKQNELGIAYQTSNYGLSIYQVKSGTTDNFVGSKSTGAELSGSVEVSDVMTIGYGAGYQKLEWNDDSETINGMTASLDVGYQADATTRFSAFADHNKSEDQFGFAGSWALGTGTFNASYTLIDARIDTMANDRRISFGYYVPLGGKSNDTASRNTNNVMTASVSTTSTLLADVMRRPDYLPTSVIAKAGAASDSCATLSIHPDVTLHDSDFPGKLILATSVASTTDDLPDQITLKSMMTNVTVGFITLDHYGDGRYEAEYDSQTDYQFINREQMMFLTPSSSGFCSTGGQQAIISDRRGPV
jgi:hypothetical protein